MDPMQSPQPVMSQPSVPAPRGRSRSWLFILIIILLILLVGGGLAYAYIQKVGPFSITSYSEGNFMTSILMKAAEIKTSSYAVSGDFNVGTREAGARPFVVDQSNLVQLREQYQNDYDRSHSMSTILDQLRNYGPNSRTGKIAKPYPSSLSKLIADGKQQNRNYSPISITDPKTYKEYDYQVTDNGNNFKLTAEFETTDAISAIKRYTSYGSATSTTINNKRVTFTKNSYSYFYLSAQPPQPFLVELGDALRTMPSDIRASAGISVSTDMTKAALADWLFNINAEGAFGDLTYKVNIDAIKKDSTYYFKINNIPNLFGEISLMKGKWIKVTPKDPNQTSDLYSRNKYNPSDEYAQGLSDVEQEYKKEKENLVAILQKAARIADEEKLISFKSKPTSDTVDGRKLTKYVLSLKKDAILPFYTKLTNEINNDPKLKDYHSIVDESYVDYLKSKEFDSVFDYYDKNTTFTLWVDADGFPAIVQEKMRIIPPDTATQLAGQQINLIFKLSLKDINKPVKIVAPANAKTIESIMDEVSKNSSSRSSSKSAAVQGSLSSMRAQAEVAYNDSGNSYGKKPFALGACKQTAGTLFGDKDIYALLNEATDNAPLKATCVSKGTTGNVGSWAASAPLPDATDYSWCVDSKGTSKQILGKLKSDSCQ
jgi:hypothetical protein